MVNTNLQPQEIYKRREDFGLKSSIEMLSEIIEKDKDENKRKDAIKYLGIFCSKASPNQKECFETLEGILISDDTIEIKVATAKALGKSNFEKALKPLKWLLKQNKESINVELRVSALRAIADIRFQEPEIKLFIEELDTKNVSIKECIKDELINLIPEILIQNLLKSLKNEKFSENHKKEIINLIGFELSSINISYGDTSYLFVKYPEIIENLKEYKTYLLESIIPNVKEEDPDLMNNSLAILRLLGNEIQEDLIEFLEYEDFIIRRNAIRLIGKLGVKQAVNSLINHLDDMYSEVSRATIQALGEIGDLSAVPELLKILDIESINFEYIDLDMKFYVIDAIKEIYLKNKGSSYDNLYFCLKPDNDVLKESIAYIFGEIADGEFVKPLLSLLKERNLDIKKNAIIALGKIGEKNAVDSLFELLENKNTYWLIKKVVVDAIFNIFLKNLYIEKSKDIDAERFFIKNSEKLIDHLRTHLDENFKVKLSIIKFLEVFGGKTALDSLIKQVNDFYRVVRIAATKAIKKIEKRFELKEELRNNN